MTYLISHWQALEGGKQGGAYLFPQGGAFLSTLLRRGRIRGDIKTVQSQGHNLSVETGGPVVALLYIRVQGTVALSH